MAGKPIPKNEHEENSTMNDIMTDNFSSKKQTHMFDTVAQQQMQDKQSFKNELILDSLK